MSSTDLDTPPFLSILVAMVIVVALHVLTAAALVAIKPPNSTKVIKESPAIEIQMVSLPPEPVENIVAEVKAEATPIIAPQSKIKPKTEPKKADPNPNTAPQQKPILKARQPVVQKEEAPKIIEEKAENKPSEKNKLEVDKAAADEQRRVIAAQAEKAAQEANAKAIQEAKAKADRDAQLAAEAKATASKAAEARAAKQAEEAAQAEANARAAASDEPVNFTASAANWASTPNFSFPDRAARRARSGDTLNVVLLLRVNKQGGIDSVTVAQSSGNTVLDSEAKRQVRSGKFKPFTKNGVPVVGNVTLPIAYAVP